MAESLELLSLLAISAIPVVLSGMGDKYKSFFAYLDANINMVDSKIEESGVHRWGRSKVRVE